MAEAAPGAREGNSRVERRPTAARERRLAMLLPILVFALAVFAWDRVVLWNEIPPYILPRPGLVVATLLADWDILSGALLNTLAIALGALLAAAIGGVALAILFTRSKWIELSLFPFAVILQVTPIIAVAPLIFIYVESIDLALLLCAFIVAFFPVLSNTSLGLNSADHDLRDLFALYGASRWQELLYLRLPTALPYFLGGLRIAGGLALIGAVVAEFTAGTAGSGAGLAWRILEAGYRLNIPRLFAALLLISATGVLVFALLTLLSHLLLRRWHESAVRRDA
jgi:NitT/TauT family transport system permease protein